jgi:4-hydroxy-2-oxoheptanedioate aldolase
MLKTNFIKEKLHAGSPVLGTWITVPSVENIDIIGATDLDFVIIDREHGPISFETAQKMVIAAESNAVSPIVRVGEVSLSAIQNTLDIGAHGLQVPNVTTAEQARTVVEFAKFPPLGSRGFSPFTRAGGYNSGNSAKLMNEANNNSVVVLNIEGADAIQNAELISEVEGVDVIFIGLFDISKSLGIPGETKNPKVVNALKDVTKSVLKMGKYVGTISTSHDDINHYLDLGMTYIVHLVDCHVIRREYADISEYFQNIRKL